MTTSGSARRTGHSLRIQVAGALVVCVTLFGLAAWALTTRAYHHDRLTAGAQLARLAGAAGIQLADSVAGAERLLGGLAAQDPIASFDPSRCQPVLSGFSGIEAGHLAVVGPDGTLQCSSLPGEGGRGSRVYADAPWVAEARRVAAPVRIQVVDPLTRQSSLVIAVAIPGRDGLGGRPGVLGAILQLDGLVPNLLGPVEQARGTTVAVLDTDRRTVLFQSSRDRLGAVPPGTLPAEDLFESRGSDGVRRVYRHIVVPDLGWHLYAASPTAVVFAPARHTVGQSLALCAVVLALLGALTVFLFRVVGAAQAERVRVLADARAELQLALVRFTDLQEEERRRIAQALHDQTIQALLATLWVLEDLQADSVDGEESRVDGGARVDGAIRAEGRVKAGRPVSVDVLFRVRSNLEAAVIAARSMLVELRPPALDELGLVAAVEQELQRFADESGISVSFEGGVGGRLPTHVETLAFRAVQEALRNVRQHASASFVQVEIRRRDDAVHVEVQDDGIGVDPAVLSGDRRPHAGIVAMRENIVLGGGSFSIGPRTGRGTVVLFSLPLLQTADHG